MRDGVFADLEKVIMGSMNFVELTLVGHLQTTSRPINLFVKSLHSNRLTDSIVRLVLIPKQDQGKQTKMQGGIGSMRR